MNIEIANRLIELRKKNNLSQEELAEKLGLSRQAISKWERAEASPDTDNLICLAKLYNISLDELLHNDASVEHIVETEKPQDSPQRNEAPPHEEKPKKKSFVHIGKDGIHVIDDEDEVHISKAGINVKDGDKDVRIGLRGIHVGDPVIEDKIRKIRETLVSVVALVCLITYLSLGGFLGLWHPTWILFLAIPISESIVSAIAYRRITKLSYPLIVVAAYLLIGFLMGGWHPWWVIFLSIPLFYLVFRPIEKLWLKEEPDIKKSIDIDYEETKKETE